MGGKSYIDAAPQLIDPDYRSGEVDPFPEKIRPLATRGEYTSLQIDHYGMDLSLTEKFQNVCTIGLTNVGNYPFQQDLEMNLDETLRVTSVVISGHPVS